MQSLRPLEQKIFYLICEFCERNNGAAPTLREIQQELGYASHTPIAYHVHNLIEKGYLAYVSGTRLRVVGALWVPPLWARSFRSACLGDVITLGEKRYHQILVPLDNAPEHHEALHP